MRTVPVGHRDTTRLTPEQLLQLRRLTTPTVYNGWERITKHSPALDGVNIEHAIDFTPQLGVMVGYAVTVVVDVSGTVKSDGKCTWNDFRRHVVEQPGPKIIVVQDVDRPRCCGSIWGEVSGTMFRGLGCVGTITDGGLRDINEMIAAGFKALGRRLTVGHGHTSLLRYNCDVEVFGRKITPGQLIHADQHGFLAVPREDECRLLDAAVFLDQVEAGLINAGRDCAGLSTDQYLNQIEDAIAAYVKTASDRFKGGAEW